MATKCRIQATHPSFLLWAVLALAFIDSYKVPKYRNAANSAEVDCRRALETLARLFSDPEVTDQIWTDHDVETRTHAVDDFRTKAMAISFRRDHEFVYMFAVVEEFHRCTIPYVRVDKFGVEMQNAVIERIAPLVRPFFKPLLPRLMALPPESHPLFRAKWASIQHHVRQDSNIVGDTYSALAAFLLKQQDLKVCGDYDPMETVGLRLAWMAGGLLRGAVGTVFRQAIHRWRADASFQGPNACEIPISSLRPIAAVLGYESPLLRTLQTAKTDYPENPKWEQYQPDKLRDIIGPDGVQVDSISFIVEELTGEVCPICRDDHDNMRRLEACSHDIGEECLEQQLATKHPSRFKCCVCRKCVFERGLGGPRYVL
ncbi:hypothetical protein BCR34DRAFT_75774 [Clohesyomyces aquaticus]|uniref:RING-type domain-containing protein n=1 Tax=Clohesyomyces aquaticus TaxID=1231657 RepID=A0A1Y2A3B3_9PLEO|nr:hypothetical protein BCR34DRAFT_75774 [Clohesyomyces aquaticus]